MGVIGVAPIYGLARSNLTPNTWLFVLLTLCSIEFSYAESRLELAIDLRHRRYMLSISYGLTEKINKKSVKTPCAFHPLGAKIQSAGEK